MERLPAARPFDVAPELVPHGREHLLGKAPFLARTEAGIQRSGEHQARMILRFRWLGRQVDSLEWKVLLAAASLSASFHKYVYESVHGVISAFTGMTSWIPAPACAGVTTLRGNDDPPRE